MRAIFGYIAESNPEGAKDFVADIELKARSLAASGLAGVPRASIARGLRAFPCRDRCLYCRAMDDQLVIVRFLHGKQDITADKFKD